MHEELDNFERNQVWELEEPPPNCKPNGTKWVWKNKEVENGEVVRNKARLVAQGYSQKEGIFISRASDQAGEGGNLCASSQVHEGHLQEVKMDDSKPLSTLMSTTTALDAGEDGEPID
jgi:surface antigen